MQNIGGQRRCIVGDVQMSNFVIMRNGKSKVQLIFDGPKSLQTYTCIFSS